MCAAHEDTRISKWRTVLGACLLLAPSTIHFIWGNLSSYVLSYIRHHSPSLQASQASWVSSLYLMMQALTIIPSGFIIRRLGKKAAAKCGVILFNIGIFSSYFAVSHSIWLLNLTLGIISGSGSGLLYGLSIDCGIEWSDDKDMGIINAIIQNSYNIMSIALNQFISWYINPENQLPTTFSGEFAFFSQRDILARVPWIFLYMGMVFATLQLAGIFLIKSKPEGSEQSLFPSEAKGKCTQTPPDVNWGDEPEESASAPPTTSSSLLSGEEQHSVKDMLLSLSFHFIIATFFISESAFMIVTVYYKSYGQLWINDDHFLTGVGTAFVVGTIGVKFVTGVALDRLGFKAVLVTEHSLMAICGSFIYMAPMGSRWLFALLVVVSASLSSTAFLAYAVTTVMLFGRKSAVVKVGLLNVATILMSLVTVPLTQHLLDSSGWMGLYTTGAAVATGGAILVAVGIPGKAKTR